MPPLPYDERLSEQTLKEILDSWLQNEGWRTKVAWHKIRGIDIEAHRDAEHWIIEVKGMGTRNPMRVNYFLAILGETLQRMSDPEAKYSIALPDLPQFRALWARLPTLAKQRITRGATCRQPALLCELLRDAFVCPG